MIDDFFAADLSIAILVVILLIAILRLGTKVVPQSEVFVIERLGKYARTLNAGLSLIVPILDRVAHRVSVLERQLDQQRISVITKDNVEVTLEARVFFRVTDAARSVYRIRNINDALVTASSSIVRSAAGKLELDELQSSREAMNKEIAHNLHSAAEVWGIEITRTEITDVIVDEASKEAQRQQLNAERKRRATIAEAEAVKVGADAEAYAVQIQAEAEAAQTTMLAAAINKNGKAAIDFEVAKRQVDAISALAASQSAKTLVLPTDVTSVIGAAATLLETMGDSPSKQSK